MPVATDDFTLLRTYRATALAALAAGDYSAAISSALAAQLILASMPQNLSRSAGSGGGSQTVAWPAEQIDSFIIRCRQQQNSSLGVQVANRVYRQPTESSLNSFDTGMGM